jgi:imidazolonepropionase-like amidohydrolase
VSRARSAYLLRVGRLVDPESAEILGEHDLLIEDDIIKDVVPSHSLISSDAVTIDARDLTAMPGLIDLHVHVTATQLNFFEQARQPNFVVAAKSIAILQQMLRRGFTTVRDAGGADIGWKRSVEAGLVVGPRLFISGHALSQTGGHGDGRTVSDFLASGMCCGCCFRLGQLTRVVDGVDAVRKAAREELLMGADQLKVMASGGVASPTDPIGAFGYSREELAAVVSEAEARGTYVMAHAYTAKAIRRAVECGVRTIEHGNLIDMETAKLVKQHQAYVVPTLVTYEALANEGERLGLPLASVAKIGTVRDSGLHSLKLLDDAGVEMGFGTDLLGESHRLQSEEFSIRARVLPAVQVIQSATTIAAKILGMQHKLGRLEVGGLADVLLVRGNPLQDISCLCKGPSTIPFVMKSGEIFFNEL